MTSNPSTRNITTTIREQDYLFLKQRNINVSSVISIGIQTLKNLFGEKEEDHSNIEDDLLLAKKLMEDNRYVLKKLGEAE